MSWHPADQRRLEHILANPKGREALKALLTEDGPVEHAWAVYANASAQAAPGPNTKQAWRLSLAAAVDALDHGR